MICVVNLKITSNVNVTRVANKAIAILDRDFDQTNVVYVPGIVVALLKAPRLNVYLYLLYVYPLHRYVKFSCIWKCPRYNVCREDY